MSEISYGTPGAIASLPTPAATVAIASSTLATPIVVTTSAPHLLQTGQALIVNGHLVNTAANGIWLAHVLSGTTFRLLTFAGADSVGVGIGAASGTVQSLALPGITVPEDAVDDRTAASVNVPFEALADMTAWLTYKVLASMAILAGGTSEIKSGANFNILSGGNATLKSGSTLTTDAGSTVALNGALTQDALSTATMNGAVKFFGTTFYRDPIRPVDADPIVVTASDGDRVILPTPGAFPRTVQISNGSEGARITVVMHKAAMSAEGNYFNVQRADATALSEMWTVTITDGIAGTTPAFVSTELVLQVESGVWRVVGHAGHVGPGSGW